MTKTVFALVREAAGPAGHGEPGEPYLTLLTDGEWFNLGNPHPLFTTRPAAEHYKTSNKLMAKVLEIELRD